VLAVAGGLIGGLAPTAAHYFFASVAIFAIFAIGFDLAFGVAGLLSFGHAAFYGAGAYTAALLSTKAGLPMILAIPCGALVGGLVAGLVGLLALRLSGVYLGLTTLAIAQLFETLVAVWLRRFTGGMEGIVNIPRPSVLGLSMGDERSHFLFVLLVFLGVVAVMAALRGSPWGRALSAIRQNQVRADQLGFDVFRLKISAFAVSGAVSGLAGALLASLMRFVNPELLNWTVSGDVLIATMIGGLGTLFGPAFGALAMACIREGLDGVTSHWHGLLGVLLILITLALPAGLLPGLRQLLWRSPR
jgi:branched-chain amino acid transport system permease protein